MSPVNGLTLPVNPTAAPNGASHVILWGRARAYRVEDFPGPLSIKSVVRGRAVWETRQGRFVLNEGSYLVLNDGQHYSITVESKSPVETFCVFFRRGFVEEVLESLVTPAGRLLDRPEVGHARPMGFFEMPLPKEQWLSSELSGLRAALSQGRAEELWLEQRLHALASSLLRAQKGLERQVSRLPAVRASTREAQLARLHAARDFIEGSLSGRLTLSKIAGAACLAPHHFHRLFTRAFRETPHQYVTRRRLERARQLLLSTDRPVTDVCFEAGFASPGSFSWLFRRRFGASPRKFRQTPQKKQDLRSTAALP